MLDSTATDFCSPPLFNRSSERCRQKTNLQAQSCIFPHSYKPSANSTDSRTTCGFAEPNLTGSGLIVIQVLCSGQSRSSSAYKQYLGLCERGKRGDRLPIEEVACCVRAASMLVIRSTSARSICHATWGAAPDAEEERAACVQAKAQSMLHEYRHAVFSAPSAHILFKMKAWAT